VEAVFHEVKNRSTAAHVSFVALAKKEATRYNKAWSVSDMIRNKKEYKIEINLCELVAKFKFGKTNPIQKSLTHYKKRTNPKIAKSKRTQTNPFKPICLSQPVILECSEGSLFLWSLVSGHWSAYKNEPNSPEAKTSISS
jgi:hypothetical protein